MTAEHSRAWANWGRVVVFATLGGSIFAQTVLLLSPWPAAIGIIVGYFMGRYVEPTLDKAGNTTMEQELGFIGFIYAQWWVLYSLAIRLLSVVVGLDQLRPRDSGSILSRSIIPGTLIRMIFADIPLYVFIWLASVIFNFPMPRGPWLFPLLAGQFVGLGISDAVHLIIRRGENDRQPTPRKSRTGTGRDRAVSRRGPRQR